MGIGIVIFMEIVFIAIFITILILATMAQSAAKSARKDSIDPVERENYKKAIDWLAWCIGIGYTLLAFAVIILIILIVGVATAGAVAAPEVAVGAVGVEAGAVVGAEVVGAEAVGAGALGAELGIEAEAGLSTEEISFARKILKYGKKYGKKSSDLKKILDDLHNDQDQANNGLLGYHKAFGGTGFFGTLERILLYSSSFMLFGFSLMSAIAAGYIGRTSTKAGYDLAIWASVIGFVPFSIMLIWYFANKYYMYKKNKEVKIKSEAVRNLEEVISGEGDVRRPSHTTPAHKKTTTQRRTPTRNPSTKPPTRNPSTKPPTRNPSTKPPTRNPSTTSRTQNPEHTENIVAIPHHSEIFSAPTHGTTSDSVAHAKSLNQHVKDIHETSKKAMAGMEQAHSLLGQLKGGLTEGSKAHKGVSKLHDVAGKVVAHKSDIEKFGSSIMGLFD